MSELRRRLVMAVTNGSSVCLCEPDGTAVSLSVNMPVDLVTTETGQTYLSPVSQESESPKVEGITLDAYEVVKEDCTKAQAELAALQHTLALYQSTIEDLRGDKARLLAENERLRAAAEAHVGIAAEDPLTPDSKSAT